MCFVSNGCGVRCFFLTCVRPERPAEGTIRLHTFLLLSCLELQENNRYTTMKASRVLQLISAVTAFVLSGPICQAQMEFDEPPIATNTINALQFSELNLNSGDFSILDVVTESSIIVLEQTKKERIITCEDEDFRLVFKYVKEENKKVLKLEEWSGIIKLGYLKNEIEKLSVPYNAAEIGRRLAIYRLINVASQSGADGILEPIVSMNMASNGGKIYFKTNVTGRLIRLNNK